MNPRFLPGVLAAVALTASAADHVRVMRNAVLTPDEGFLLGNGDLSVSVYQKTDALVFRFGKNDVWDRRVDDRGLPKPATQREVIDGILKDGWKVPNWSGKGTTSTNGFADAKRRDEICGGPNAISRHPAPTPKPVGEFLVNLPPDLPPPQVEQRLIIEEGRYECALRWDVGLKIAVEAVVHPAENALAVKWTAENWNDETRFASAGRPPVWLGLMRWADPPWREWTARMAAENPSWPVMAWPDSDLPPLPPPARVAQNGIMGIEQTFYPDLDYKDGFRYRVWLSADPAQGEYRKPRFEDGKSAWVHYMPAKGVFSGEAVLTVKTSNDPTLDAPRGVRSYADCRAAAASAGRAYWAKSAMAVPGDAFLEDTWYATWHVRRCVIRPGAVPPGLFLPSVLGDFSRWNGDYHMNYNLYSIYWGDLTANRLEQAENYFEAIDWMRPVGRKIARDYYGCRGVFMQLEGFPITLKDDINGTMPLGRMVYPTGWTMTRHWDYYLYTKDRDWLRRRGYPHMRDCALFYLDFLKKAPHPDLPPQLADGKYHAFPSVSGESGFRDPMGACDRKQVIRHIAFCLRTAAAAARELGVDEDLAVQWRDRYENLATCRNKVGDFSGGPLALYSWEAQRPEFGEGAVWGAPRDWKDGKMRTRYSEWYENLGHQHHWKIANVRTSWQFIPERDYPFFRDGLKKWTHPNGLVGAMTAVSWARCGWTESLSCMAPFQDMMLMSWDDAIGVFERWPKGVDAGFRNWRAHGGFVVSAAQKGGLIVRCEIVSEKGEDCVMHGRWRVVAKDESPVVYTKDRFGRFAFKTKVGGRYSLSRE